ncbi:hypothetical protein PINS_up022644, partial [Pythium insidiosum]
MCVVRVDENTVLKTRVLYNTLNPVWAGEAQVELAGMSKRFSSLSRILRRSNRQDDRQVCSADGPIQQDFRPPEYSSTLAQWVKTGQRPEETKKNVSNQVKEKEYTLFTRNDKSGGASALLGLGGSSKLRASDDDFQLLLTIGGLRDMRVTSSTGGGVLGLGNLVSSTPNVSPYVSIHVAKEAVRTNVAKIAFTGTGSSRDPLKGSAAWNETFTLPLKKKDIGASNSVPLLLSLKDKSMLHDETLG